MYEVMLLIQCLSIVVLAIESIYVFFHWKSKQQSYLFIYCFAALINNLGYLFMMTAETARESMMANQFCYFGKVWIPIAFLAMLMELCEFRVSNKIYGALVLLHASVFFLVLTSGSHNLYYSADRVFVNSGLFPHIQYGHTVLYNCYMGLVFMYVPVGLWVLLHKYRKDADKENKVLYGQLFAAIVSMVAGLVAFLLGVTDGYDTTALGYAVSSLFMFVAIFRYHLMDNLSWVRDYVVDTLSEGIIAVDKQDNIIYYNESAKIIYPQLETDLNLVAIQLKEIASKKEVIRRNGKVYEPVLNPLLHGTQKKGSLYILADVTERYAHMEELEKQRGIAEAASASKSAFLSVVSHEIRTPMNAVAGMTELLLREPEQLNEKQIKYLTSIQNSSSALVMIVNDILDQSKIEAGKMEIVEDVYTIRSMIEDMRLVIENRIGGKNIRLTCEIQDEIPDSLIGDSLRIRQVLMNLLNNAVKFTEEGFIQLRIAIVEQQDGLLQLQFSVKDSGQGIKEADLKKLGKSFSQIETKRNHSKEGTGLGLAISKNFVELMGGALRVSSEYGVGTEFTFCLWQQIATDAKHNPDNIRQAWQEESFKAPDAQVLIVDDTELNLTITKELLSPWEMTIDTAISGEKAIELIKTKRYQLVIMDYMMPYMDGVETTMRIRSEAVQCEDAEMKEYFKNVPIIALSGENSEETKEKFLRAGIDDFIAKPLEGIRLNRLLLKWLPQEMIRPGR